MGVVDKLSIRLMVVCLSMFFLLVYIAYAIYRYPELMKENFNAVLTLMLSIATASILKWLFKED